VCLALIHGSLLPTMIVAKRSPQTDDAKHQHLSPLSESISISQNFYFESLNHKEDDLPRSLRQQNTKLNNQVLAEFFYYF
jgi:hypothetical protein